MSSHDGVAEENIHRIKVLVKELGLQFGPCQSSRGHWQQELEQSGFLLSVELETDREFARINAKLSLDKGFADWFGLRLDDLQQVCYHYGCYHLVSVDSGQITVLIGFALYFGGLQYYALKEAIENLKLAVTEIRHLLEPGIEPA